MRSMVIAVLLLVAVLAGSLTAGAAEKVSLPKDYEKWEKSKQKIVTDKKSLFYGSHYLYVDKKAMSAYKSGGAYPEGSRFVVVFYNIKDEAGKQIQGKKNMIVMMKRDKRQQATGGWLFAGFTPEGKPSGVDPVKTCFDCHLKDAKERSFVISKYADFR